jgi:hypothetical protein
MGEIAQYLYIMGSDRGGPLKIGIAKDPAARRAELQTGAAYWLELYWVYPCPGGKILEPIMHRLLARYRLSGEWFRVPVETAMGALWIAAQSDGSVPTAEELDQWICHIGACDHIGHMGSCGGGRMQRSG